MADEGQMQVDGVTRSAAEQYAKRGWSVIPIPHRSKNPGFKGWERMRLTAESLDDHFNGRPQNVGVPLGEPSGWLIDVDLDHPRAIELAPQILPPTPAIFGRPGNPRSHWLYCVAGPVATKKFRSKSAGMIVEVRSTGMQTVLPPSTHESGEAIRWEEEGQEPAEVHPDSLIDSAKRLADAVRVELGEKAARKEKAKQPVATSSPQTALQPAAMDERARRCLAAMLRIKIVDQRDGSHRLFVAACRAVEHDLDGPAALAAIRQYAKEQPFPRSWSDDEILQRLRDAEKHCRRGKVFEVAADGCIALGSRDPASGKLVFSPTRTLPTANSFVGEFHLHPKGRTLHCYAGLLNRTWLIRRIVWRMQSLEEGGLSERALRQAKEFADGADLRVTAPREAKRSTDAAERTKTLDCRIDNNSRVPLPGTLITRRYKGQLIQVKVVANGFEFEGELFKSLSAVAKRITGSHWNGYKFFNLNKEGESR